MRTAKHLPGNQSFFERYATLIPTLNVLGVLAQIVSALTEVSIIYAIVYSSMKDFAPFVAPAIGAAGAIIGTLFIEVGLRKFTPYTMRAILYRRFSGLDLAMSVFILLSTAALLATSGLLSFKNSKTIIEAMTPPAEEVTTDAAQHTFETARADIMEAFRLDSSTTATLHLAAINSITARYGAEIGKERANLRTIEAKERRGILYTTQRNQIKNRIASLEAMQDAELAAQNEKGAAAIATLRAELKNTLKAKERELEQNTAKVEEVNSAAIRQTRSKVDRYGGGLAWFTVVCLTVFLLSVALNEVHSKGSEISEAIQPTQYDFAPGIIAEAGEAITERINFVLRSWIRGFATATPAPPLPLTPSPLYDTRNVQQPRFAIHYDPDSGGAKQIFLNTPINTPSFPGKLEVEALGYFNAAGQLRENGLDEAARQMELKGVDVIRLYLGTGATPAAVEELRVAIMEHLRGNGSNPFEHLHRRPIGFNRNIETTTPAQPYADSSLAEIQTHFRICQHCSKPFDKKHWAAKYCSDGCRVMSWEKRTGAKLKNRTSMAQMKD